MLSYEEMQYLTTFAKAGTLSDVAEIFHTSQPTITRAMKKAEHIFGVPLFERTKNSIKLNNNGILAANRLEDLIKQTDNILNEVRKFDIANRTISIGSAAAIQLSKLIQLLTNCYPEKAISTELKKPDALLTGLNNRIYQLIVLPYAPDNTEYFSAKIEEEHLMFLLPKMHRLSKSKNLTLSDLNGENILLFSDIGFWADILKEKMPTSRFIMQSDRYAFKELILNSTLPCFATNLTLKQDGNPYKRIPIPISDREVNVSYYLVCRQEDKENFHSLYNSI